MLLSLAQAGTPAANLLFYPSTPKAREGGAMRYLYLHKGNFLPHVWARYGAVLLAPEPNSRELQYAPGSPDVPGPIRVIIQQFLHARNRGDLGQAIKGGEN